MNLRDRQILLIAPEIINPRSMPCVGLGYIGAYLADKGYNVRIVDAQFTKQDPVEVLRRTEPTLVAIAAESRTIHRALKLARIAKHHGHTTLLGGLHVSLVKEEMLNFAEVDYAITGDGEIATHQLVEVLQGERDFEQVSGLMYRAPDGSHRIQPNNTEVVELDSLPLPDYRLAGIRQFPLYPLVTSRDCPYKCSFCTVGNISHGRFRYRSPAGAVDEIVAAKERYNIRGFLVVDENFSFRMDRAMEFCELLIERKVNLPWTVFEGMRADRINDKVLTTLRASGCHWIFFGIESAENAVLKAVRKGEKLLQIERAIHLARQHGFKVGGFLIIGLPGSNFEKDMRSIYWAMEHLDKAQFWMAIPYYGTTMYTWVREHGRILREPTGDNLVNTLSTQPYFDTPDYSAHQRKQAHSIAALRFGLHYFYEYLDHEAYNRLHWSKQHEAEHKRQLIKLVSRYDPSYLPQLITNRTFPEVPDPVTQAIEVARRQGENAETVLAEPLPTDMHNTLASFVPLTRIRVTKS